MLTTKTTHHHVWEDVHIETIVNKYSIPKVVQANKSHIKQHPRATHRLLPKGFRVLSFVDTKK